MCAKYLFLFLIFIVILFFALQLVFERRILLASTLLVGLSACIWTVAISTDHWLNAESQSDNPLIALDPNLRNGTRYFQSGHMGLFRGCTKGFIKFDRPVDNVDSVAYSEYIYSSADLCNILNLDKNTRRQKTQ